MRTVQLVFVRCFLAIVVIAFIACGGVVAPPPAGSGGEFDGCPTTGDADALTPVVSCVLDEGSARHVVFGYRNEATDKDTVPGPVVVRSGPENWLDPTPDPRLATGTTRPPSTFLPGEHPAAFSTTYISAFGDITWHLGKKTASSAGAPACRKTISAGETRLEVVEGELVAGAVVIALDPTRQLSQTIQPTETPLAQGAAVGEVPGEFHVSEDGAASYTVPLWVPPGRAGMQPALALAYDSGAGNGPAGVGWTVTGLSQIARCVASATTKTAARSIQFKDTIDIGSGDRAIHIEGDQLCLDGDPLLKGVDGSLHPQRDPFTRVRPTWANGKLTGFQVELRSGRVMRYGDEAAIIGALTKTDADGRELIADFATRPRVTLAWLLKEASDRSGNSMRYSYLDASLDRTGTCLQGQDPEPWKPCFAYEVVPNEITYTHGGLGATKRVRFEYEERVDDADVAYVGGFPLKRSKRLHSVYVRGPKPTTEGLLRSYQLEYSSSALNGRSLLHSIRECDGENVCKPATTFDYEAGSTTFKEEWIGDFDQPGAPEFFVGPVDGPADPHLLVGDFNGDGLDDIVYSRRAKRQVQYNWYSRMRVSATGGYGPEVPVDLPAHCMSARFDQIPRPTAQDVDADGIPELVYPHFTCYSTKAGTFSSLEYRVYTYVGGVFVPKAGYDPLPSVAGDALAPRFESDFDGDGLSETLTVAQTGAGASASIDWTVQQGFYKGTTFHAALPFAAGPFAVPVDGTSRARLLVPSGERYGLVDLDAPKRPFAITPLPTTDALISFADSNSDGMADALVRATSGGSDDFVAIATGHSFRRVSITGDSPKFNQANPSWGQWPTGQSVVRFDYFQDGHPAWLTGQLLVDHPLKAPLLRAGNLTAPPRWTEAPTLPSSFWGTGNSAHFEQIARVGDVNGDGLDDLFLPYDSALRVFIREGQRADLLTKVHAGLGDETSVSYHAPPVYATTATGHACAYPLRCSVRGVMAAYKVTYHSNVAAKRTVEYDYQDAASNALTGSFVGFRSAFVTDLDTGESTAIQYDHRNIPTEDSDGRISFFEARAPVSISQYVTVGSKTIRTEKTNAYEVAHPDYAPLSYVVRLTASTVSRTEETPVGKTTATTWLERSTSSSAYDNYGNLVSSTVQFPDLHITETNTTTWEAPDLTRWLIARPKLETRTSSVGGLAPRSEVRERGFESEPSTGLVYKITDEPNSSDPSLRLETTILRVAGQPRSISKTDLVGNVRRIDVEYDSVDGTQPARVTDPLGYVQNFIYHPGLGVLAESTDPNGVRSRVQYDGFGRLRKQFAAQCPSGAGIPSGVFEALCGGSSITYSFVPPTAFGAAYAIKVTQTGGPSSIRDYDGLGRLVHSQEDGFELSLSRVSSIAYDPIFVSSPSKVDTAEVSGLARTTRYAYDALGRVTGIIAPDKGTTSYRYEGLTVWATDPEGAVSATDYDQLGRVVTSVEKPTLDKSLVTRHQYGPFGLLTRLVDPQLNGVDQHYDRRGRLTSRADGDSNTTRFVWNAFGELTQQTDAKGRIATFGYDALGRTIGRKSVDGLSCFQYDAGPFAIGRRTLASRRDVRPDGSDVVIQSAEYDPLGRPSAVHQTINDGPDRTTSLSYDASGRPSSVTYPEIAGRALRLDNTYSINGYLRGVTGSFGDHATTPPPPAIAFWQKNAENLAGELTQEAFGNGVATTYTRDPDTGRVTDIEAKHDTKVVQSTKYQWYRDGNVRRTDDFSSVDIRGRIHSLVEQFNYDGAKRLSSWYGPWGSVTYGYDDASNLTSRVAAPSSGSTRTEAFTPGPQGTDLIGGLKVPGKPTPTLPPPHAIVSGPSADDHYTYDEAGDQTSAPGRTVEWTTFHLPRRITKVGDAKDLPSGTVRFVYGPDNERVQKVDEITGEVTTYFGSYEVREKATGEAEHVMAIAAGGRQIAQMEVGTRDGTVARTTTHYFNTNHLGTPRAITDETGARVDLVTHEPFGRRVDGGKPTEAFTGGSPDDVRIGFTGQEEDRSVDLVNLHGRLYDAKVGRFTAPDPVIGGRFGLNRYAYVRNNPVNHTDVTGYCFDTIFGCFDIPGFSSNTDGVFQIGFGGPTGAGGSSVSQPTYNTPSAPTTPPPHVAAPPTPYTPLSGGSGGVAPASVGGLTGFAPPRTQRFGAGTFEPVPAGVGSPDHWWDPADRILRVHGEQAAFALGATSVAIGTAGMGMYAAGAYGAYGMLGAGSGVWAAEAGLPIMASPVEAAAVAPGAGAGLAAASGAAAPAAHAIEESVESGAPRATFGNLFTGDVPTGRLDGTLEQVQAAEKSGTLDYVVQEGKVLVGEGHPHLAGGGRVDYAGTVTLFEGRIVEWTNGSGHYKPAAQFAGQAGLPMLSADGSPLFRPVQVPAFGGPVLQMPVF